MLFKKLRYALLCVLTFALSFAVYAAPAIEIVPPKELLVDSSHVGSSYVETVQGNWWHSNFGSDHIYGQGAFISRGINTRLRYHFPELDPATPNNEDVGFRTYIIFFSFVPGYNRAKDVRVVVRSANGIGPDTEAPRRYDYFDTEVKFDQRNHPTIEGFEKGYAYVMHASNPVSVDFYLHEDWGAVDDRLSSGGSFISVDAVRVCRADSKTDRPKMSDCTDVSNDLNFDPNRESSPPAP